jgi:hypothetical protein
MVAIAKPGEHRGATGLGSKQARGSSEHDYSRQRQGEKGVDQGTPQVGVGPGRIAQAPGRRGGPRQGSLGR